MVGVRHSVANATAFLKITLPIKEGQFRFFMSHKLTVANLLHSAQYMSNYSYVIEQARVDICQLSSSRTNISKF